MESQLEEYLSFPLDEPIDERRYQRHATFVPDSLLTTSWSPQGYRPEILNARRDLLKRFECAPLQELCSKRIRQGSTPSYGEDGPVCIMPRDVRPLLVNESESRVSIAFANENPNRKIKRNAVLINRSGAVTLGRASIFLDDSAFISEHVFECEVSEPTDPAFIAAFLNSWWGKRSLESGIAGSTGQLQLPQSHVINLPIPRVDLKIQEAIGDRVRKAEALRRMANKSKQQGVAQLEKLLAFAPNEEPHALGNWNQIESRQGRLDAEYYRPEYTILDLSLIHI